MSNLKPDVDIKNRGIKIFITCIATAMAPAILYPGVYFFFSTIQTPSGDFLTNLYHFTYSMNQAREESIFLGFFAFVVAFFHICLLGLPLFFLGLRLRMIRWWTIFIASFIVGSLPYTCLVILASDTIPQGHLGEILGITFSAFGLFGVSGGVVFWLLWRYWILEKSSNNLDEEN
ncbi:MAG: hypothetical protein H7Y59_11795 [Anaerolineales bacterium]|nr:hypothetical protein [Anaerolineales bacterium]